MGRSRGGLTTKIHMLADALGRPLRFIITAGQVGDITQAPALLDGQAAEAVLYLLDETRAVADQFDMSDVSDRITIGIRTGYAFYDDRFARRKILIGVNQLNTSVNNYLDGPFDQLPDNFLQGDVLRNAILSASPDRAGQIDRFGNSPDGETRYLIAPYMQYEDQSELGVITDCAAEEEPPVYYNYFSYAGGDEGEPPPAGEDTDPNQADPGDQQTGKPADQPVK